MAYRRTGILVFMLFLTLAFSVFAQEDPREVNGRMWTFDDPPVERFRSLYGFEADQDWLDDVRKSALRFGGGCSASFVSAEGLVMTNYHCGIESVDKVTVGDENLRVNGFYAVTLEDERQVPELYVDQLMEIVDVTGEIVGAMSVGTNAEEAFAARDSAMKVVTERLTTDGLRCEVVSFYNGARFSAYRYKRHNDVRLVFSSELHFAFFGGIYDFWAYPRWSFDCDLFRVYEDGKPLQTEHYFRWSASGAAEDEAVFVVGNPGRTNRLVTADMLAYERDVNMPYIVQLVTDRKETLENVVRNNPEQGPVLFDEIFGIVNAQEAYAGRLIGLRDDELMAARKRFDEDFRTKLKANEDAWERYGDLWAGIRSVTVEQRAIAPDLLALRTGGFGMSAFLTRAGMIVDWVGQMGKPEDERDPQHQGKMAELLARRLSSPVKDAMDVEIDALARQLKRMQNMLQPDNKALKIALKGEEPEVAARRLLAGTVLKDSVVLAGIIDRRSLDGINDDLLDLAAHMLPRHRAAAERSQELAGKLRDLTGQLGKAQYDVYGSSIPPDATFTLRISDGVVSGYPYNGTIAPTHTTFYGMYDHHHSFKGSRAAWDAMMGGNAWELPPRWKTPPPGLDLSTPMNFISTTDIIGGNSGSAIINRKKEVVGLAFDGNIESLAGAYIFAPEKGNRTIGVHSQGIIEALRHTYKATRIVDEIERGRNN